MKLSILALAAFGFWFSCVASLMLERRSFKLLACWIGAVAVWALVSAFVIFS